MSIPVLSNQNFLNGARIDGLPDAIAPGQPLTYAQQSNFLAGFWPSNAAAITAIGTAVQSVGTVGTPTLAVTNRLLSTKRTTYTSAATIGALASHRQGGLFVWRGNAASRGGFNFSGTVGTEVLVSSNRAFFGLIDTVSAPTNVDPLTSVLASKIGLAINSNTGNWRLIHNAATAPTVIDLGANFPVNQTDFLELTLYCPPNGSNITYQVRNKESGAIASGTLTTNIPALTTFLSPQFWICNNAAAASCVIASGGWILSSAQR